MEELGLKRTIVINLGLFSPGPGRAACVCASCVFSSFLSVQLFMGACVPGTGLVPWSYLRLCYQKILLPGRGWGEGKAQW